jgi:FtsH-binding integral membrane protein
MFRIIIGVALLVIGFFVMCAAIAATHTGPPTDLLELDTWLFWSICIVPMGLALWLLLGKSLRRLFR